MAVRRNHEHSHHCKTSRLSLRSPLSLSLAQLRSISLRRYPWRRASACTCLPKAGSLAIRGERNKGSQVTDVLRSVNGTASKCKTFLATATEECCPAKGTLAGHFTRRLSPSPMPGKRMQQQRAYLPLKRSS